MIQRSLFNGKVIQMSNTKGITITNEGTLTILGTKFQLYLKSKFGIEPVNSLPMLIDPDKLGETLFKMTEEKFEKIKDQVSFPLDLSEY